VIRTGAAGVVLALALLISGVAGASDATFRSALASWSLRIGADARGIGLSALNRHPRRLIARALRFRRDALRARRAISTIAVSTGRARRAKRLARAAFGDYALVGSNWALAGRARLAHRPLGATRDARLAATFARRANALLVEAGRLLR
jgi:hypothetical protein